MVSGDFFCPKSSVALLAEGVDRNIANKKIAYTDDVALLAEGVDRNFVVPVSYHTTAGSPSSRRAWIEIGFFRHCLRRQNVALLAEGVDRNPPGGPSAPGQTGRPPRGGRG